MGQLYRTEIVELAYLRREAGEERSRINRRWEKLRLQSVALIMGIQDITGRPELESHCVGIRVRGTDIRATFYKESGEYDTTVTFPAVWFELDKGIQRSALQKLHDKKEAMTRWMERQTELRESRELSRLKALADKLGFVLTPRPLEAEDVVVRIRKDLDEEWDDLATDRDVEVSELA